MISVNKAITKLENKKHRKTENLYISESSARLLFLTLNTATKD